MWEKSHPRTDRIRCGLFSRSTRTVACDFPCLCWIKGKMFREKCFEWLMINRLSSFFLDSHHTYSYFLEVLSIAARRVGEWIMRLSHIEEKFPIGCFYHSRFLLVIFNHSIWRFLVDVFLFPLVLFFLDNKLEKNGRFFFKAEFLLKISICTCDSIMSPLSNNILFLSLLLLLLFLLLDFLLFISSDSFYYAHRLVSIIARFLLRL